MTKRKEPGFIVSFLQMAEKLKQQPFATMPSFLESCNGVRGFSSPSNLALIYEAVSWMPDDGVYCEMGVFQGLSARAAIAAGHGSQRFILVDDFREAQRYNGDNSAIELANGDNITFHPVDAFQFLRGYQGAQWDVCYYDAGHSFQDTYTALSLIRHKLADYALVFIDDVNMDGVRAAVNLAGLDFGYKIVFDAPTPCNGHWTFWNGFMALQWTRGEKL